MRCFIAIDLDGHTRSAIGRLQKELQDKLRLRRGDAKWVEPTLIHLTLKFLGDVRDNDLPAVTAALQEIAAGRKRFDVAVGRVGTFGSPARVLWVGIDPSQPLSALVAEIEAAMEPLGFARESRPYEGHLTLCRIKSNGAGVAVRNLAREYEGLRIGSVAVEAVRLYKSDLTKAGPIYTVLKDFALQPEI